MTRERKVVALVLALGIAASACAPRTRPQARRAAPRPPAPSHAFYVPWGEHSEDSRLAAIGPAARRRWRPYFENAAATYPPASVLFAAFKREKRLDVYAGPSPYNLRLVRSLPITAASGGPGPKLREGDRQVPEGVYTVESLHPNSLYHVALRLAYPNEFDRLMAGRDRRRNLGSDIMIHGSDRSIGCLAVGDLAAEDLYVMAADSGIENVSVLIAPRDFRRTGETQLMPGQPAWVGDLYADLDRRLRSLPPAGTATARTPAVTETAGTSNTELDGSLTARRRGAPRTTIDPAHGR